MKKRKPFEQTFHRERVKFTYEGKVKTGYVERVIPWKGAKSVIVIAEGGEYLLKPSEVRSAPMRGRQD